MTRPLLTVPQFYVAWVVVGIIWLWGTMLIAIFYPILDGGMQQILQVYRGLTGKAGSENSVHGKENGGTSTSPSSPSGGSVSDVPHAKESKSEN
jgi:hypothetical protein